MTREIKKLLTKGKKDPYSDIHVMCNICHQGLNYAFSDVFNMLYIVPCVHGCKHDDEAG